MRLHEGLKNGIKITLLQLRNKNMAKDADVSNLRRDPRSGGIGTCLPDEVVAYLFTAELFAMLSSQLTSHSCQTKL